MRQNVAKNGFKKLVEFFNLFLLFMNTIPLRLNVNLN